MRSSDGRAGPRPALMGGEPQTGQAPSRREADQRGPVEILSCVAHQVARSATTPSG